MQPLPQATLQQPAAAVPAPGAGVSPVVPQPMNRAAPMRPSGPVAANPTQRAASAIPPSQPLPPVQGLPADAPKLVINGGVYSAARDQRMLIVNGQVVREGADLGSGVKLEQITARAAVLSFRGSRYSVSY
jgi:general secretion pathway protein B